MSRDSESKSSAENLTGQLHDGLLMSAATKLVMPNTWIGKGLEGLFWTQQLQFAEKMKPLLASYLGENSIIAQLAAKLPPSKPRKLPPFLTTEFPAPNNKLASFVMPSLFLITAACGSELLLGVAERGGFNSSSSFLQAATSIVGTFISGKIVRSVFDRGSTALLAYKASENPQLYYELGNRYFERGDYKSAEQAFLKMPTVTIHYQPRLKKDHLKYYSLGKVYLQMQDHEKALQAFEQASAAAVKEFVSTSIPSFEAKELELKVTDRYQFLMHYEEIKKSGIAISEEAEVFAQAEFAKENMALTAAEEFIEQVTQTTLYKNAREIDDLKTAYRSVKGPQHSEEKVKEFYDLYEIYKKNHKDAQHILIQLICFHKNAHVGKKAAQLFTKFFTDSELSKPYQRAYQLKDENPELAYVYFFIAAHSEQGANHTSQLLKKVDEAFDLFKDPNNLNVSRLLLLLSELNIPLNDLSQHQDKQTNDQRTFNSEKIAIIQQKLAIKKQEFMEIATTQYRSYFEMGMLLLNYINNNKNISKEFIPFLKIKARYWILEASKAPAGVKAYNGEWKNIPDLRDYARTVLDSFQPLYAELRAGFLNGPPPQNNGDCKHSTPSPSRGK